MGKITRKTLKKIPEKEYLERLAIVRALAEKLGVRLDNPNYAVATQNQVVKVRNASGDLEVKLYSNAVTIESPRAPRISVRLVDPTSSSLAPEGAIYEIMTSMFRSDDRYYLLDGDVASVHVGDSGFILDQAARRRASELFSKEKIRYIGQQD